MVLGSTEVLKSLDPVGLVLYAIRVDALFIEQADLVECVRFVQVCSAFIVINRLHKVFLDTNSVFIQLAQRHHRLLILKHRRFFVKLNCFLNILRHRSNVKEFAVSVEAKPLCHFLALLEFLLLLRLLGLDLLLLLKFILVFLLERLL